VLHLCFLSARVWDRTADGWSLESSIFEIVDIIVSWWCLKRIDETSHDDQSINQLIRWPARDKRENTIKRFSHPSRAFILSRF